MSKPVCITFAAVSGIGKSPVAYYLSCNLMLPIFSNDAIRLEVREDMGQMDIDAYIKRREQRLDSLITQKKSFIYDASVDRRWSELKESLGKQGYRIFVISFDVNEEFILKLYKSKGYTDLEHLQRWQNEHAKFLEEYSADISLHITEAEYKDRLDLSLQAAQAFLSE